MAKSPQQNFTSENVIEMEAEAAISPYRAVKAGAAAGQVVACSAITDVAIGVSITQATAAGERVQVQLRGIALVTCSAAVNYGVEVMPTGSGSGKCSTAAGATAKSFGVAIGTTTTADGELQKVLLACPNVNGPANS
jgi:hypothetical protein